MVRPPIRRDNPRAIARGLSLRTGGQTMLYVSLIWCILFSGGVLLPQYGPRVEHIPSLWIQGKGTRVGV